LGRVDFHDDTQMIFSALIPKAALLVAPKCYNTIKKLTYIEINYLKNKSMKSIKTIFFILLFTYVSMFESYCQSDNIIADSKPFQYLIGMVYSDYAELGNFIKHTRSSTTYSNGKKISSAKLIQGEKQIITSEIITFGQANEFGDSKNSRHYSS
jgi:hypothetical protein